MDEHRNVARPYTTHDLDGLNKVALEKLVRKQFHLWPHKEHKWAPKRDTTVKVLKKVLLDPKYGFSKVAPPGDHEKTALGEEESKSTSSRIVQEGSDTESNDSQSLARDAEFQAGGADSPAPFTGHLSRESSANAEDIPPKGLLAITAPPPSVSGPLRPLKVSLTDHRKMSGPSASRIRIIVQVEEDCNRDFLAAPDTWYVHAEKFIEAIQTSPAFVDGPARLSTLESNVDPNDIVYDVFAMIDEASKAISTPSLIKVVSNAVEVHVLEVKRHLLDVSTAPEPTYQKAPSKTSRRQRTAQPQIRRPPSSSQSSDHNTSTSDGSKDQHIVKYLSDVTASDPDPLYISEWRFFLASKGKTLNDANLIRTYKFAVDFVDRWQNKRVIIEGYGECRILQRHIYEVLKRNASWFVPVHELMELYRQVGPGGEAPDATVISYLDKGEKTGAAGLLEVLRAARRGV